MANESLITMLNFIRQNASDEFQARIPVATAANLEGFATGIVDYQAFANEAVDVLVNRIALVEVGNQIYENPLAMFKRGGIPMGSDVQDIFTNLAVDKTYDPTGNGLLTATEPDVKALYYRLNRKAQYPITVREEQLKPAFLSMDSMNGLLDSIVTSLYSGDNTDEFLLMKNLFAGAITSGRIGAMLVADPGVADATTSAANSKALVKTIKTVSGLFKFIGSHFNSYYSFKPEKDIGRPCQTFCPRDRQVLLIRSDVLSAIDVDVLAAAFNIDKVDFMGRVVEVDDFGLAINTLAVLIDETAIQVFDNKQRMTNQWNGKGMFWNYWWNHWQIYGMRTFANARAFVVPSLQTTITTMTEGDATLVVASTTGMVAGQAIAAEGIPGDATILSITNGTTLELSEPATRTETSGAVIVLTPAG